MKRTGVFKIVKTYHHQIIIHTYNIQCYIFQNNSQKYVVVVLSYCYTPQLYLIIMYFTVSFIMMFTFYNPIALRMAKTPVLPVPSVIRLMLHPDKALYESITGIT